VGACVLTTRPGSYYTCRDRGHGDETRPYSEGKGKEDAHESSGREFEPEKRGQHRFFLYNQMLVVGSTYWNLGIGLQPGDVANDEEGIRTMRNLGKNMAWLLKKIHR